MFPNPWNPFFKGRQHNVKLLDSTVSTEQYTCNTTWIVLLPLKLNFSVFLLYWNPSRGYILFTCLLSVVLRETYYLFNIVLLGNHIFLMSTFQSICSSKGSDTLPDIPETAEISHVIERIRKDPSYNWHCLKHAMYMQQYLNHPLHLVQALFLTLQVHLRCYLQLACCD